jgi:ribosome-associated protein
MTKRKSPVNKASLLDVIIAGVQEVKGNEIIYLDLREIKHAIADYFVVCHGNSHTQVDAIARSVEKETETILNESALHIEGRGNSEWVLMDYGDIVVHIFHKDARPFYALEDLWADAKATLVEELSVKQ